MKTLRQTVSEIMVRVHLVPPELADRWVREMTPHEVKRRFLYYVRSGLAKTAGMELSVASATIRAVNVLPSQFATPATTQARSRHSTLSPKAVATGE